MSLPTYTAALRSLRKAPRAASPLTLNRHPHKPILLLSVLDLIATGWFADNRIYLSPELNDAFDGYWSIAVPHDPPGDITTPFTKLTSDGFWHLTPQRHPLTRTRIAKLDDALFTLANDPLARATLQATLIESHFAPEIRPALRERMATTEEAMEYGNAVLKTLAITDAAPAPAVRSQAFRAIVVRAYEYRCAICGIRIFNREGRTVVEAAHIQPWSVSHDDAPDNGLSLCRLCHWSFDAGVLAVADDYTVLTSSRLLSGENLGGHLITTARRPILLPAVAQLHPATEKLRWHRENVFVG